MTENRYTICSPCKPEGSGELNYVSKTVLCSFEQNRAELMWISLNCTCKEISYYIKMGMHTVAALLIVTSL